jgi:PII-like signaling protein
MRFCRKNEYLEGRSIFPALLTGILKSTLVPAEVYKCEKIMGYGLFSLNKKLGDYSVKATITQYFHGTHTKNLFYLSI